MTVKGKMRTLIAIICVLVVGLTASIIGVVAAVNQTVSPTIRVSYVAANVAANVSATYQVQGDRAPTALKDGNVTEIVFVASQESTVGNLSMNPAELTANNTYVLFTYKFTNNNQDKKMQVTLQDGAATRNVNVVYSDSDKITGTTFEDISTEMRQRDPAKVSASKSYVLTCDEYGELKDYSKELYVLVEIANDNTAAYYETNNYGNAISFVLELAN